MVINYAYWGYTQCSPGTLLCISMWLGQENFSVNYTHNYQYWTESSSDSFFLQWKMNNTSLIQKSQTDHSNIHQLEFTRHWGWLRTEADISGYFVKHILVHITDKTVYLTFYSQRHTIGKGVKHAHFLALLHHAVLLLSICSPAVVLIPGKESKEKTV